MTSPPQDIHAARLSLNPFLYSILTLHVLFNPKAITQSLRHFQITFYLCFLIPVIRTILTENTYCL